MRRILLVAVLALGCDNHNGGTDPDAPPGCGDCDAPLPDAPPMAPVGAYVSAMRGDDSNMGTEDSPVKTIAKGVANAMSLGGDRSVIIGEGTYAEKVTLVEGIDLLGGHQCNTTTCDWARDIAPHKSIITNMDF